MSDDQVKIEMLLAKLKDRDEEDYTHSLRVQKIVDKILAKMQLSDQDKQTISTAALLHDIGLIEISEDILNKSGRLNFDEYEEIKLHTQKAEGLIKDLACFAVIKDVILHHHENINGFGYPDGLEGEEIPLGSRIIHIAEAFDSMTSERKGRKNVFSQAKAIAEINEFKGRIYDPKIVDVFLTCFEPVSEPQD